MVFPSISFSWGRLDWSTPPAPDAPRYLRWVSLFGSSGCAALVYVAYRCLLERSQLAEPMAMTLVLVDPRMPSVLTARISWGICLLIYLLVAAAAFVALGTSFWRLASAKEKNKLSLLVPAAGTVLAVVCLGKNPLSVQATHQLVVTALGYQSLPTSSYEYGTAFGIAVCYAFIVLAIMCAAFLNRGTAQQQVQEIEQRLALLRRGLYAGAAILAGAMLYSNALHALAVPYATTKDDADLLKQVASTLSTAQGSLWTLLLVAIYVPAAWPLLYRAGQLASSAGAKEEQRKWLEKYGISRSIGQQLTTAIASFAPLLVGNSGKLVEILSS